jgi:hypothetical protein
MKICGDNIVSQISASILREKVKSNTLEEYVTIGISKYLL